MFRQIIMRLGAGSIKSLGVILYDNLSNRTLNEITLNNMHCRKSRLIIQSKAIVNQRILVIIVILIH